MPSGRSIGLMGSILPFLTIASTGIDIMPMPEGISFILAILKDDRLSLPIDRTLHYRLRSSEAKQLLGEIKYLNGGLFARHWIEKKYEISIANEAFGNWK